MFAHTGVSILTVMQLSIPVHMFFCAFASNVEKNLIIVTQRSLFYLTRWFQP